MDKVTDTKSVWDLVVGPWLDKVTYSVWDLVVGPWLDKATDTNSVWHLVVGPSLDKVTDTNSVHVTFFPKVMDLDLQAEGMTARFKLQTAVVSSLASLSSLLFSLYILRSTVFV